MQHHWPVACLAQGDLLGANKWLRTAEAHLTVTISDETQLRAGQALVALAEGNIDQAGDLLLASLEPAVLEEITDDVVLVSYPAASVWMVARDRIARAVELWHCAKRQPFVHHSRFINDLCGRPVEAAAQQLPPEVRAAAEARGRALDLHETAKALLEELKAARVEQSRDAAPAASGTRNPTEEPP